MDDSPSSLVAAALQANPSSRLGGSGSRESQLVETYLERLEINAGELKGEIFELIKEKYQEFRPLFHDTAEMTSKVEKLSRDMDSLSNRVEVSCKPALQTATQNQTKLKGRLEDCNGRITLLSDLLSVYDKFEGAQKDQYCSNYLSAAKLLKEADEQLQATLSRGCRAQIYVSMKDELHRQRSGIVNTMKNAWAQAFKFSVTKPTSMTRSGSAGDMSRSSSSVSARSNMKLELNNRLTVENGRDISMMLMLECLEVLGVMPDVANELGHNLLRFLLLPVITSAQLSIAVNSSSRTCCISLVENAAPSDPHQRPSEVYSSIVELCDTLSKFLTPCSEHFAADLKSKLGEAMWDKVSAGIIEKCLALAVPTNTEQMKAYETVISATRQFEEDMYSKGFVPGSQSSTLSRYVGNVNVHFASKKCEDLLARARSLMLGDLHNTVLISPQNTTGLKTPSDVTSASSSSSSASFDKMRSEAELSLAEGVLYMPRCRVSAFVQDLIQLAQDTLQEATRASVESAIQLFFSVRNVFELYPLVVPTFHKRSVSEVPLLAAVQHNNSFYLAHQLLTLGHQFRSQLPAKSWLNEAAAFVDLVPSIRRVGEECLVAQLRQQHDDLLASLEGAQQFSMSTDKKRSADISRALRQVVYQLNQLAAVWRDVLPKEVFLRAIALLADTVVNSVVSSIVALEDISATEATALHTQLSNLKEELPPLLSTLKTSANGSASRADVAALQSTSTMEPSNLKPVSEEELCTLVMRWRKFTYLLTLLDAKLQVFVDLWDQGKGPLANAYTAAEVRRLIRALFQNTERRSAALASIRTS